MLQQKPSIDDFDQAQVVSSLYVGTKIIKARPATNYEYADIKGIPLEENTELHHGYLVEYPDGYVSWSPQHVFEEAYRKVSLSERALF